MTTCRTLLLLTLTLAAAAPAPAQLKKERLPELGLPTFYRPRHFDVIPLQPGEQWKVLYMREKPAVERGRKLTERRYRPELYVVRIEKRSAVTGERAEPEEKRPKVFSLDTWLENDGWKGWRATHTGPGKRDREFLTHTYSLAKAKKSAPEPRREFGGRAPAKPLVLEGYAYVWETPRLLYCLVGRCASEDSKELFKLWESVGQKMRVSEPKASEADAKKLERLYRDSKLPHIPYRIAVREAMVDGWEAEDTQHYIVVYNTSDEPLVRKVLRDLETIREAYVELFPPSKPIDAVSTVRICADRDEYMAYGGMPRSAGYWNSRTEELVLYDAEKQERGKRPDDSDTFVVLYHEAFHQYIHYSTGELPPHSWFNEGYGDYFSGAQIKNGKVRSIGVNPWRVGTIQLVIAGERGWSPVPWRDIIEYSQGQYYTNGHLKYAQGWSMIYFLNRAPIVEKHPDWQQILPTYFETLKVEYRTQLAELGEDPEPEKRAGAGQLAREAALKAAFADVDLDEIDEAWKAFTLDLEDPRK